MWLPLSQLSANMSENGLRFEARHDEVASRLVSDVQDSTVLPLVAPTCIIPTRRSNLKEHAPEEWEALRPRFTELYLSERRRLADVSRILRDERGFCATDKQYKDRIRKWGLKKNFKNQEKREALAYGVGSQCGEQIANEGTVIPRHRLKRFARDAKLLYVQRVVAGATLPAEPELSYDLVLDLSRSLFDQELDNDPRTLHSAFAAIDRLTKQRSPVLAFEVMGVSDTVVRYGLRRLERKTIPGLAMEMIYPPAKQTEMKQGLGVRFCGSLSALLPTYKASEEDEYHKALYNTFNMGLYKACQYVYCPGSNPNGQHLYKERRTVYRPYINPFDLLPIKPGQAPEVRCPQFNPSALAAQALYLRAMAHSLLASGVRGAPTIADAEMFSSPLLGSGYRVAISPRKDYVLTIKAPFNVAMHFIKRGDLVAGAIQFCPGHEGIPLFMEGQMEVEGANITRMLTAMRGSQPDVRSLAPETSSTPEPFLTDDDAVETEFIDASYRAALQAVMPRPQDNPGEFALVSRPMTAAEETSGPGRLLSRLSAEASIVDRAEPWKQARKAQ